MTKTISIGDSFTAKPGYGHMPFSQVTITVTELVERKANPLNDLYRFTTPSGNSSTCVASWLLSYWDKVEAQEASA